MTGIWLEEDIFESKDTVELLQCARCSNCERYLTTPYNYYFTNYNYCPHCGSDMRDKSRIKEGLDDI